MSWHCCMCNRVCMYETLLCHSEQCVLRHSFVDFWSHFFVSTDKRRKMLHVTSIDALLLVHRVVAICRRHSSDVSQDCWSRIHVLTVECCLCWNAFVAAWDSCFTQAHREQLSFLQLANSVYAVISVWCFMNCCLLISGIFCIFVIFITHSAAFLT